MRAGKLLEIAPPGEIGGRDRAVARVSFVREGPLHGRALPDLLGTVSEEGDRVRIATGQPTTVIATLTNWAAAQGCDELPGLSVTRPSLEDIYLAMIGDAEGTP